jgi:hypothetical protein
MNRLRHYATHGNTRDFRPEDEEKPSGEVVVVYQAWSEDEKGKSIDLGLFCIISHLFLFFFKIKSPLNMIQPIALGGLGLWALLKSRP